MPKKIFLVDDQDLVRRTLVRTVRHYRRDDDVTDFASPVELLNAVLDGRAPDLILTDRSMPELDGETLASNLKYAGFRGSIVMITGDEVLTPPPHVDEVLRKPYDLREFGAMLTRHLDTP